jgi:uncharacterized membrane protein YeaQ/YmgE (transglycosylase-associated protein family)
MVNNYITPGRRVWNLEERPYQPTGAVRMLVEHKRGGNDMFWTVITWIIIGGLAGWIASMITGTNARVNGWMNIVVGIIGAIIGGLILQLLGASAPSGFSVGSLLTAILGAIILLSLVRAFRRDTL